LRAFRTFPQRSGEVSRPTVASACRRAAAVLRRQGFAHGGGPGTLPAGSTRYRAAGIENRHRRCHADEFAPGDL